MTPLRIKAAWAVAVGMDALQMLLFPITIEGAISPWADGLDFIAMALLWVLLGWHWTFLPSVIVKVIPIMDLAPTWTIAVAIATRGLKSQSSESEPNSPPKDVTPPDDARNDARTIVVEAKSTDEPESRGN